MGLSIYPSCYSNSSVLEVESQLFASHGFGSSSRTGAARQAPHAGRRVRLPVAKGTTVRGQMTQMADKKTLIGTMNMLGDLRAA